MKPTTRIAWLSRDDDGFGCIWSERPRDYLNGCWYTGGDQQQNIGRQGPFHGCRPGQCIKIRITESVERVK